MTVTESISFPAELEPQDKASQWLMDARLELERVSDIEAVEADDDRFLQRMSRGAELSERRTQVLAKLTDRRRTFLEETGNDIIVEQYYVLRHLLDAAS